MEDGLNTVPKGRATESCNKPNVGHWEGETHQGLARRKRAELLGEHREWQGMAQEGRGCWSPLLKPQKGHCAPHICPVTEMHLGLGGIGDSMGVPPPSIWCSA